MYYRYKGLEILNKAITPYGYLKDLNIFLMRHGESECNALQDKFKKQGKLIDEQYVIEETKMKLTEKGEEQAFDLGKRLQNHMEENKLKKEETLVLVSPLERARKTFEKANETLKFNLEQVFVFNALRELDYGIFHMLSGKILRDRYTKIYDECHKISTLYYRPILTGESASTAAIRAFKVTDFIKEYKKENKIKNVFLFGHGNINRIIMMNILNLPPEFYDDFKKGKHCSVINIKNGKYNNVEI